MVAMNAGAVPAAAGARGGWVSWPLLVFVLFHVALLANGGLLGDPGVYWHVVTGERILQTGAIPFADPFSHTMPGAKWEPFEWLAQVAMALIHRAAGYGGLVAVAALTAALTLALLDRFLLRTLAPIHAFLLTFLGALGLLPHVIARPHMFAMPLLVLWVGKLAEAADRRVKPSLALLPVMTLWANLHGSFTLGLGIAAAFALDALADAWPDRAALVARARGWLPFLGLAVLASLITPHHIDGLLLTWRVLSQKYALSIIVEWRSPDFQQNFAFAAWLLIALGVVLFRGLRLPPVRALMVVALLHFALQHQRNFENLTLLVPLIVAAPLAAQLASAAPGARQVEWIDRLLARVAARARPFAVALALAALAGLTVFSLATRDFRPKANISPVAAVDSVAGLALAGPVLNHPNFGGYLIARGIPVFLDDRTQMYGDELYRQFLDAVSLAEPGGVTALLERWHIGWTLLHPGTPALVVLDALPGWRRHYADDIAVVHVREAAPDRIINR
jgi:hypothetical protein